MRQSMLAGAALAACQFAASPSLLAAAAPAAETGAREVLTLADGWRFKQDDALSGAETPRFADADWEKVRVPHTWNRVGYYIPDPAGHINRADNVNKKQGIGWYRLSFTPPPTARGRRAWLQIDAASRTAEVWLNGIRLGRHDGAFSRFRFDATTALRPGAANILVVRTDNSAPKEGDPTADILPLTGDFFVRDGLYRPVSLILTDAVHVDMLDFGGPGVYAATRSIAGSQAEVAVRTRLRNEGGARAEVRLVTQLIDANGAVAARAEQPVILGGRQGAEQPQTLKLAAAHLWQGTQDPYLYTLRTEIRSRSGQLLDSLDQAFGVRQMRLDADKGFILNGKPLRLHGVGFHQDQEGKDWALGPEDFAQSVAILREMGANTIRLTHYQHGQPIHELADRYGLVLWDEIPLVTSWTLGRDQKEASPRLLANARQQLQELIRQNYNHPSVAVWGIANEVDFGPGRPDFLGVAPPTVPDPMPLLRNLNALAKAEDASRPTVLATCCEDRGMPDVPVVATAADAAGANRYFGWYYGRPEEVGPHLDALHAKRPMQPLAVTEYGAGGAVTMHSDDPRGGPIDPGGPVQPEEYQSLVHEANWAVLASKPYLWTTWLWNSFDFGSTVRREGDSQDINTKGLVTYDRQVKKDAFYFYRANWSDEPTVHVNGRRYVDRAYPVTDVRVYSNAPATELTVNGRSLGAKADCPQKVCVWPAVTLAGGVNHVVATGRFGSGEVRDDLDWRLDPALLRTVRIDSGAVLAGKSGAGRYGSDAFFEGGSAGSTDKPGGRGRAPVLATIAGTADRDIVASYREGDFRYRVPVENGRYTVSLTFVEPSAKPGERQFDVIANGGRQLAGFDVAAAAAAPLTAIRRSFAVTVSNGALDLQFKPTKGRAIVSAVEISR